MTLEGTNTYVVGSNPGLRDRPRARRGAASRGRTRGGRGSRRDRRCPAHPLARGSLGGRADARRPAPVRRGRSGATRPPASPAPRADRPAPRSPPSRGAWAPSRPSRLRATRPTMSASCWGRSASAATWCSVTVRASFRPTVARWRAYLDSLERLRAADLELLCPGHGPYIEDPAARIDEYLEHRLMRERRLLAELEQGERSRARLLDRVWDDVPSELRPAAAVVMQAHLEKLEAEGRLPEGRRRSEPREPRVGGVTAGELAKRFGLAGAAFTALAGTTAAGLWHQLFRRPLPRTKGRLRLDGLEGPVEIGRDRWGVPHIHAQTRHDLWFSRGLLPRTGPPLAARPLPADRLRAAGRDRRSPGAEDRPLHANPGPAPRRRARGRGARPGAAIGAGRVLRRGERRRPPIAPSRPSSSSCAWASSRSSPPIRSPWRSFCPSGSRPTGNASSCAPR